MGNFILKFISHQGCLHDKLCKYLGNSTSDSLSKTLVSMVTLHQKSTLFMHTVDTMEDEVSYHFKLNM